MIVGQKPGARLVNVGDPWLLVRAEAGLDGVRIHDLRHSWSADIHAEWVRSLLADRPDIDASVLDRTRAVMDGHFPDAVVTGYEAIAARLDLPDPGDRHVLAAAIRGQADVIVTGNLRDFPADRLAPYALAAQHPDSFVAGLFEADPDAVIAAVRSHRAALRNGDRRRRRRRLARGGSTILRVGVGVE